MTVALRRVTKRYRTSTRKEIVALDAVDLELAAGELCVVVGPSGSGKTTLLRVVAGLEAVADGRVEVAGRDVTAAAPGTRNVAMVFQDHALYPHLDVTRNITFGLRAQRVPAGDQQARLRVAADLLGLGPLLGRQPGELSGGERQRVALARAIVREPDAFLLDEPLSGLDAEQRAGARADLRALQRRLGTTMVLVTHDQVEAMTLGDRVVVLREGRVEQEGPPAALYDRPGTTFVARLLGPLPMNLLPAGLWPGAPDAHTVGIRAEHVRLTAAGEGVLAAEVTAVEILGPDTVVHTRVGEHRVLVRTARDAATTGDRVGLSFEPAAVHAFDSAGRRVAP